MIYVFFYCICFVVILFFFFFFFSSRRRHTRWNCDWSSDVCSSDLPQADPRRRATVVSSVIEGPPVDGEFNVDQIGYVRRPLMGQLRRAERTRSSHVKERIILRLKLNRGRRRLNPQFVSIT